MAKAIGRGGIDSPDFIETATPHQNPVQITLSELAIRLGWPHVFERTGNVLYYDNFDCGLGDWTKGGDIATDKPQCCTRALLASPYSARLTLQGGDAAFSYMRKRIAYPYLTTYGFELSFLPTAEFGMLDFGMVVYTGEYKYSAYGRYWDVGHNWWIFDDTGEYVEIATYSIDAWDVQVWHPVKVVFDFYNKRFARIMFDAEDYGLSDYGVFEVADTKTPHMEIYIGANQVGSRTGDVYIDNVLITINEPL